MLPKLLALIVLALVLPLPALAVVFAGQVRSDAAQPIFVPPANSNPVVLRSYIADGTKVKAGDVLLRIDAGQAATQVISLDAQLEQTKAKIAKETAELQLKAVEAEQAQVTAQAALDTAKVDATIPKQLISALDYDRYHAELERSEHDLVLKQKELADARAAVTRREQDGKLELDKIQLQRSYYQALVGAAAVRAKRDGTVVHAFDNWYGAGGRFEEGSSANPGMEVGEVVGSGSMSVRAWVLAPDRAGLMPNEKVCVAFDALPGRVVDGTIQTISGASEARAEWGDGRYFTVDIAVPAAAALPLKPGMSVRVQTPPATGCAATAVAVPLPTAPVRASGEIQARDSVVISPPQVEDLWQLTITQMAGDGAMIKKGEPIVAFDGGEVVKKLTSTKSTLEEKLRQQDKLRMELAVKARSEAVTVADAAAQATKAQRKATQPADYVPGVEYKKLLIDRAKAEKLQALSVAHGQAAVAERAAEQREADADVARLKADVARLQTAIGELNVSAPRDGIFMHASNWDGSRIDVGTQVWRGKSVATIPDLHSLDVRANLAERDLTRVHVGDAAQITLEGGAGQVLSGRVTDIGLSVHSKSRVEPVPVVDLDIALDPYTISLKPGQPVRVDIVHNAQNGTSP